MIYTAIAGAGAISDSHIEAFLAFPERCKVVAVCDRDLDKAKQRIERHGLDAVAVTDMMELKRMQPLDLVSICLPPALHCDAAVGLLRAGKHVLCEKPLAPSVEECDRMIAAARESGALLSAVAQNRFKPDVQKVRKLCDSGLMGTVHAGLATSLWWRGMNYYNLAWRGTWESEGGGCTMAHGIHHIDLFLWLMGEAESVSAVVDNMAHTNSELEDISLCTVRFKSGAVGSVISSILHHREEQRLMIDAQLASVELPLAVGANRQLENGFPVPDEEKLNEINALLDSVQTTYSGHTAQIDDMLRAIEQGTPPGVTGEDGRRAIEFITATYQSAFTGKPVRLPLTPQDPFYTRAGVVAGAKKFYSKTVSVERFADDSIQVGGTL